MARTWPETVASSEPHCVRQCVCVWDDELQDASVCVLRFCLNLHRTVTRRYLGTRAQFSAHELHVLLLSAVLVHKQQAARLAPSAKKKEVFVKAKPAKTLVKRYTVKELKDAF